MWLSPAGTKGFEPEDVRKRLVVENVHPMSVLIALTQAPEPVALDDDTLAHRRQDCVNDCRHLIVQPRKRCCHTHQYRRFRERSLIIFCDGLNNSCRHFCEQVSE
jgi:hypothetical protein